jgi:hypothetical protein
LKSEVVCQEMHGRPKASIDLDICNDISDNHMSEQEAAVAGYSRLDENNDEGGRS